MDRGQSTELAPGGPPSLEEAFATLTRLVDVGASLRVDTRGTGFFQAAAEDGEEAPAPEAGSQVTRLRLAETRYRVLIEQIPVVTFLASLVEGGGNEIYVSPQIEDLLGFTQEEWVSDPVLWFKQVHRDDRERLSRDFAAMCITGEPFRGVVRVFTRDGVLRWVHMEARFVCDEVGRPLFLQGAGFDVTDQFQAQETRERLLLEQAARAEAERERRRLLEVFTNLPAAIVVLRGPDHIVDFVNPVAAELARGSQVTGEPWKQAFPQFGDEALRVLDTVRITRQPESLSEHPFRSGRASNRYFNLVCQPLPDVGTGDQLLLIHAAEVTQEVITRRQVEQALRLRDEAHAELERTVKTREQFLSAAAHDLKTPIASTRGWAQLLARRVAAELPPTDWLQDGIASIERGAARMAMMVEEFLDLASLQSGVPLVLERRPVDLVQLVQEVVADHQRQTDRHDICIETSETAITGSWDQGRLRRVINNLVDNAVKYSPEGGSIRVALRLARRPELQATVEVSDEGVGVPAADLHSIFEQYHRASNVVGRISGTGVGLNASYHIVRLHGGSIEVASEVGKGSTFTVRLPLEAT